MFALFETNEMTKRIHRSDPRTSDFKWLLPVCVDACAPMCFYFHIIMHGLCTVWFSAMLEKRSTETPNFRFRALTLLLSFLHCVTKTYTQIYFVSTSQIKPNSAKWDTIHDAYAIRFASRTLNIKFILETSEQIFPVDAKCTISFPWPLLQSHSSYFNDRQRVKNVSSFSCIGFV